jgi:predicted metallo-beta-lactamase superfamily hydrolase
MVGTGKWSTEDAKVVFAAKVQGASDELIVHELLKHDPRRIFKKGSIKYVVDNFKNFAE